MASLTNDDLFNIPGGEVERSKERDNRTQLEKDIESNAVVIPIFPWIENGQPKGNMVPLVYGNTLQQTKGGALRVCDQDCPYGSVFWRLSNTQEHKKFVPPGWTNYGGLSDFVICSLCKADEIQQEIIEPDERANLEGGREESIVGESGGTGGTGNTNKPVQILSPGNKIVISATGKSNIGKRKREKTLVERAEELFKGKLGKSESEKYNNLIKAIEQEKSRLVREAAEKRRILSSTTGGKKRRKSRRRKRTRKRRKSRRRKRR